MVNNLPKVIQLRVAEPGFEPGYLAPDSTLAALDFPTRTGSGIGMPDQNETSTVWASAELELPTDLPTDLPVLLADLRGLCCTHFPGRFMKVLKTVEHLEVF